MFDFGISSSERRGRGEDPCCSRSIQNQIVSRTVEDPKHDEMDLATQSLDDHVAYRSKPDDDGETESVVNAHEDGCCSDCCKPNRKSPNQPTSSTILV